MLKKISLSTIFLLTALTIIFFSNKTLFYTFLLIDISVITFTILVWLNDRYHNEEIGQRVLSFPQKDMIKDIIQKQANMLKFDKIEEKTDGLEVYKGKHKVIDVTFEKDENGNLLVIDGKYIAKIEAPEYVLHNIDQEIWSHIGLKK
ncbi:MAG: hypothetical protein N2Z81_05265 [Hydrogenothermaceae bacterium]|nr:hypothetical protein [Hydrogenothermaceae bacterium]